MSKDRLRRARLGALAGVGALALSACAATGAGNAVRVARTPTASGVSATVSPSLSPGPSSSSAPSPSPSPSASIGESEGTLRMLTFQDHVEYGAASSKVDWLTPFERQTGCRVRLDRVETSVEMAEQFSRTPYDVVSPSPDLAGRLMAEGKVATIDTGLIEAYKDIPKRLRELPAVRRGDRVYGVPYLWGINEIMYEGERPRGPEALYTASRSAIRDNPMSIADAALALKGFRPELKIDDPFQLTPAQLDAAEKLLAERDGPERVYWKESSLDVIRAFAAEGVRIAQALPYDLDVFKRAGRPVKALEAPMTGWVDSWMVVAGNASPNCAYKWLNWVSSPEAQGQASDWTWLAPANLKACDGRARRVCEAYHARDAGRLRSIHFAVRPSKDCGGQGGECTDYTEWEERWKQLVK
ncbi:extracellular solute-binding protein [Streptosporangium sp. NPDC000396]|uniref:extracellular solute-binding protein n=1 Tax=Streptosporangium sp. NPDC000396 TaxID=3366185 RepID=UPI0036BD5BFC